MKIILFLSCLLVSLICQISFASDDVCKSKHGSMYCSSGEVDSLFYLGDITLSGTHVLGAVHVLGNLDANNAEIGSGDVTGDIDVTHLKVNHEITVTGNIKSVNSLYLAKVKFTGDVRGNNNIYENNAEITGDAILNNETFKADVIVTGKLQTNATVMNSAVTFNSCLVELNHTSSSQINVSHQAHCDENIQKIYLHDKSYVKGNIHFAGGNGKVYVSKDSAIAGQVTGGTIVRE